MKTTWECNESQCVYFLSCFHSLDKWTPVDLMTEYKRWVSVVLPFFVLFVSFRDENWTNKGITFKHALENTRNIAPDLSLLCLSIQPIIHFPPKTLTSLFNNTKQSSTWASLISYRRIFFRWTVSNLWHEEFKKMYKLHRESLHFHGFQYQFYFMYAVIQKYSETDAHKNLGDHSKINLFAYFTFWHVIMEAKNTRMEAVGGLEYTVYRTTNYWCQLTNNKKEVCIV